MSEEYEVEVERVKLVTPDALLCVIEGDEEWIPKSQIVESDASEVGDIGSIIITGWLARKKGWL